jgi:carbon monoxide dehydrogenase subunit G
MNGRPSRKGFCFWVAILLFFASLGCSTKYVITSPKYADYKGEINQHTRLIRAQKTQVFELLTHEESLNVVCPTGTIVSYKTPPPYRTGTLVETRIEHIFKLSWRSRVQEVIQDTKIRLTFLNGFFSGGTEIWELEGVDEHTRVTHTIVVQPKGLLRKLAWNLKVRRKHDKMLEKFLDNMKHVLENRPVS